MASAGPANDRDSAAGRLASADLWAIFGGTVLLVGATIHVVRTRRGRSGGTAEEARDWWFASDAPEDCDELPDAWLDERRRARLPRREPHVSRATARRSAARVGRPDVSLAQPSSDVAMSRLCDQLFAEGAVADVEQHLPDDSPWSVAERTEEISRERSGGRSDTVGVVESPVRGAGRAKRRSSLPAHVRGHGASTARRQISRHRSTDGQMASIWSIVAAALAGLGLVVVGLLGMPGRAAGPISIEDGSKRATQPLATTAAVSSTPASDETPVVRGELAERFSSQPLALRRAGAYLGLPIRDVPVATWILAKNPETAGNAGLDYGRVDPAELRIVRIRLVKPDGGRLFIDKLERLARLTTEGLQVGSPMFLAYPELGLAAHGEILSIDACPPIPPRPGPDHCLITSKFVHEAATLVELHVAGLAAPILVTPNHPLWSEDRREFVRADHLAPGEHLRSALDEPLIVTAVVPRERPAPVYNLEVDGEHVYFVSPAGVLAHNTGKSPECDGDAVAPNKAVIGKLKDLENLRPGENTLLKHLPDQGSPKANWAQNSSVLRQEMNKGLPIRDGSVNPVTGALENNTGVTELPQRIHSATRGW